MLSLPRPRWRRAAPALASVPSRAPAPRHWRPVLLEVVLLASLYLLYRFGRLLSADRVDQAFDNARAVYRLQQWVRLPDEAVLQAWLMAWPELIKLSNQYYVAVHFPATLAFLVWGYLRRPLDEYRWARALLVSMTGIALVLHVLIPLAPPRMFPQLGFADTMTTIGPSAYGDGTAAIANQYAAMPSLHVGWALLIAVVVLRTATGPIRVLAVAHAALTSLVVVVTANHWWVDGLVATALLGVVLLLHRRPGLGSPVRKLGTASARGGGEP